MNTYEEKLARKAERYQELSSKAKDEARNQYERSNRIADAIPFGQPILVGHHSEAHHRRDIERIHNGMNRSIEAQEKAEYYENKMNNALDPKGISSDDPDAIPKLKLKLQGLETKREQYKAFNKKARQEKTDQLPDYILPNLGGNIRTVRERIEYLERQSKIQDSEEDINGVKFVVNKEENRVQLFFPGIPEVSIRDKLKSNGFHWSPYNKCWQRQLSDWAVYIAKDIISVKP